MKTIRLLIVALLVVSTASAQSYSGAGIAKEGEYSPTVYLISVHETDTIYTNEGCDAAMEAAALNRLAVESAIQDYRDTHRLGFQQVEKPQFIFTTKNNKFSFAVGGYINLRAGYDFDGGVNNIDFIPYDIPMQETYANRQKLMMDATTSRIYLKAVTNSNKLGRIVVFIDADFRGGSENSYTPRVRSAYVSLGGFTFGRDVTTFCDLLAAPQTIDFQGPNAYNFNFATMIRYQFSVWKDVFQMGMAAELPNVSGTYGPNFAPIPQRVPDFPVYLQLSWGRNRSSHIRASAVFRDIYMHNTRTGNNTSYFGWGVQGSGHIRIWKAFDLFFNGVYGQGITPYIQDLTGSGLDFTPNPGNYERIQTTPMYGWQAAAQINLVPGKLHIAGGYSAVTVAKRNGFYAENEYREGQYIFGNIFWNITPRFKLAGEYLYGTRENMDGLKNHANRANLMVQYNF